MPVFRWVKAVWPQRGLQGPIKAGIRPEHIVPAAPDDPHAVRMKISILENTGREAAVFLTGADIPDMTMVTGADFSGRAGQEVYIRLKPEKILLFNTETGYCIWRCLCIEYIQQG